MRTKQPHDRRCSYVVLLESGNDLRELASYLSTLGLADCDVVVLDPAPKLDFEDNARTLRWVGRHLRVRPEDRAPGGGVDLVRAAAGVAACEKVIVAAEDVRYTPEAVAKLCELLDMHEVVEPQDYLDPMPWWGGIDAGRILVHRGIEPEPDHGATYGFRGAAIRALRSLGSASDDSPRRLASHGAEVYPAADVFVRREPGELADWLTDRPRLAAEDFALPMKTAFFLALLPLLFLLAILGGAELAGGYAGVVAFASLMLAVRGRSSAKPFFPLRACLYAPLWIAERSVSVYWALFRKLRGAEAETAKIAVPDRGRQRVASGE